MLSGFVRSFASRGFVGFCTALQCFTEALQGIVELNTHHFLTGNGRRVSTIGFREAPYGSILETGLLVGLSHKVQQ